MSDLEKINEIYLKILNEQCENQVDESIRDTLVTGALIGSTLLGSLNAGNINNNSSKLNDTSNISKTAQNPGSISLNADELFIAKTIYSETSTLCSYLEILAVACVIQNRIGLKDFGGCKNAVEVCKYPGAFSSVTKHNVNWDQYKVNLNKFTFYDARLAKILMSPTQKINVKDWMKDIVYYHDKSISKPKSWDNKYYKTILVKETQHFKFYKVEKVGKK